MNWKNLLIIMVCLLFSAITFGQSKIEQSKKELNQKTTSATTNEDNVVVASQTSSNYSSNNNSIFETLLSEVFLEVIIYGTYGLVKYGIVGDYKNEAHLKNTLSKAPYYDGVYGNYKDSLHGNNFRIDLEDSFMYDTKNMMGNHFKAKIRPSKYFYIKTDIRQLFERNISSNIFEQLAIYDINLCYDRIRLSRFNLGWTLGASYIASGVDKGSISIGFNADYFLKRNISLHGSAQWCSINGLPINYYELQSKFHQKRGFISLGYDYLVIGTPTYKFTTVGLGVYF